MRRPAAVPLLLVLLLAGCADGAADDTAATPAPAPTTSTLVQRIDETIEVSLGGVPLTVEVADEPQERAIGLMGRTEVPAGTGMIFHFDEPVSTKFYMFNVPVPLTAVFLRDGVAVHVAQMAPCTESEGARCPLYGAEEPFDTVVETAPATLADVRVGDRLEYR